MADRASDRINCPVWLKAKPASSRPPDANAANVLKVSTQAQLDPVSPSNPSVTLTVTPPNRTDVNPPTSLQTIAATQQSRSDLFVDCLRKQDLGPFSRYRKLLYDKLEEAIESEEGA